MAKYIYPAVFTPEGNGYFIDFPDFDACYTQGSDIADGITMAEDVLSLMLTHFEDEQREIPAASSIKKPFPDRRCVRHLYFMRHNCIPPPYE